MPHSLQSKALCVADGRQQLLLEPRLGAILGQQQRVEAGVGRGQVVWAVRRAGQRDGSRVQACMAGQQAGCSRSSSTTRITPPPPPSPELTCLGPRALDEQRQLAQPAHGRAVGACSEGEEGAALLQCEVVAQHLPEPAHQGSVPARGEACGGA